ncbi:hypothetical protein FA13DRAFT_1745813 [Coprinellus micaceus]|uniref:Uncharacterized protein n=1 Tax=Coprinellus micaceus TaxID=71717 RepID=A0A4Y7SAW0_COPMI|nr:hypothetical protein FA13DRAFT_1745813 [Coprinellus micaceus]
MFSKFSVSTLIAALALAGIAHAEVTPSEPGPGQVFNAGSTCTVSWEGDKESTTAWKGMAIQLMTGDNFSMFPHCQKYTRLHRTHLRSSWDATADDLFHDSHRI